MDLTKSLGFFVSGSDRALSGHDPENVKNADLVVYTNAVKNDNCELKAARELGVKTVERAQYLADISARYEGCVAIAGCHGKSTTTAMTGAALFSLDPTVHVGAENASRIGSKSIFVTEACEYNRSYLKLSPSVGVVLNVAYDHPDCYKTEDELRGSYAQFISRAKIPLVNGDDEFLSCFDCKKFGLKDHNHYRAENVSESNGLRSFDFSADGKTLARVELSVHGEHNVYNALAAMSVAHTLGIPADSAAAGIKKFRGISRRFEYLGSSHGKEVYTDYAHHPDEITATVSAAKEIYRSVTVAFQPHTYSRTAALFKEEATALMNADTVIVAPIFAAREKPINGVTSELLVNELISRGKAAVLSGSLEETAELCAETNDEAVIFMGAGDITEAAEAFTAKVGND